MRGLAGKPLRTRDTDAIETPARFATVTTVGRRAAFFRVNVFTVRPKGYAGVERASTRNTGVRRRRLARLPRGRASVGSSLATHATAVRPANFAKSVSVPAQVRVTDACGTLAPD